MAGPAKTTRPSHIEIKDSSSIAITWDDGHASTYEARALRLICPCAHCVEEWTGRPLLNPVTVPAQVQALDYHEIGNYAVQFLWSDGHYTGIYTYDLLRHVCPCARCKADRGR